MIKEYFSNYPLHVSDITFDLAKDRMEIHQKNIEPWRVALVDTGANTMTGGRLKRVKEYVGDNTFCMTYGDGVGDVDIAASVARHVTSSSIATVTVVQPPGRFGAVVLEGDRVKSFQEKTSGASGWINGGFFVVDPEALTYIDGESAIWEQDSLQKIAEDGKLVAYKHNKYWQCMDTLRDKNVLERKWQTGKAPWKVWE